MLGSEDFFLMGDSVELGRDGRLSLEDGRLGIWDLLLKDVMEDGKMSK